MPDIGNIGITSGFSGLSGIGRTASETNARNATTAASEPQRRADVRDRVEVSDHARYLDSLRSMPPIRAEKVAEIKAQIEAGTYETDEKLATAMNRLLEELGQTDGDQTSDRD